MTDAFDALDQRWTVLSETCWHAQRLLTQSDENDQNMDMDCGGGDDDLDGNNGQRHNKDGDDGDGVFWFQQHVFTSAADGCCDTDWETPKSQSQASSTVLV